MLMQINMESDTPIYQQIRNQVILGIASGTLMPGEQLPSVRQMADEIGINMMTVSKAYTLLKDEGYIATDRRYGTKVSETFSDTVNFQTDFLTALTLLLAESKIHGISAEAISSMVSAIYHDFEQEG